MHLVVGLGNPGVKYAGNRHNVGFMAVDKLAERWSAAPFRQKFHGEMVKTTGDYGDVVLLKPQTFMNLSGQSVQQAAAFFRIATRGILVIHDELDLPFGTTRVKVGGGNAGHNGLRSIAEQCGSSDFIRIRIGIGRPKGASAQQHVLSDFGVNERIELDGIIDRAASAAEAIVMRGTAAAMNEYNAQSKPTEP